MGHYKEPGVGTLRVRALPNFWNHSSCDHGVSTRLLPAGPRQTAVRVYWLVDEQAVEGRTIRFTVEARDEREPIGDGTHERVVVNVAKFDQRVKRKLA